MNEIFGVSVTPLFKYTFRKTEGRYQRLWKKRPNNGRFSGNRHITGTNDMGWVKQKSVNYQTAIGSIDSLPIRNCPAKAAILLQRRSN